MINTSKNLYGQYLTCTVDSISSVAMIAGAGESSLCVSAVCILTTVVELIILTLIDVCKNKYVNIKSLGILKLVKPQHMLILCYKS